MINPDEIDGCLLRFLLDEMEVEEREEVEAWLLADEEHRVYYRQFQRLHLKMQWGMRSGMVRGDFEQFRHALMRRRWLRVSWWSAACVVFFVFVGIGYWLSGRAGEAGLPVGQQASISPGTSRAVLYLASGEAVSMGNSSLEVKEKDGTNIVISERGELVYQALLASGNKSALSNRVVVPRGGEFTVVLADGTKVWMNAGSELCYPSRFTEGIREVRLTGEAYFDVVKDDEHPFVVRVNDLSVTVHGTRFNIHARDSAHVETVLVQGSVSVTCHGGQTFLKPNQMAEYRHGVMVVKEVDVLPYVAWKDGNFIFKNESLESIMNKLALWYDLDVFYAANELREIRLSGNLIRYKDVQELFASFERISDAHFRVSGKTVTIDFSR